MQEISTFLDSWLVDPNNAKGAFIDYMNFLQGQKGVSLDFKARPGISYSLRAKKDSQKERDLFVLVDVVDDEPENRWLSVCFYADLITDPEEQGDFVPGGLLGADAICFNLENEDLEMKKYILARIKEANANA